MFGGAFVNSVELEILLALVALDHSHIRPHFPINLPPAQPVHLPQINYKIAKNPLWVHSVLLILAPGALQ